MCSCRGRRPPCARGSRLPSVSCPAAGGARPGVPGQPQGKRHGSQVAAALAAAPAPGSLPGRPSPPPPSVGAGSEQRPRPRARRTDTRSPPGFQSFIVDSTKTPYKTARGQRWAHGARATCPKEEGGGGGQVPDWQHRALPPARAPQNPMLLGIPMGHHPAPGPSSLCRAMGRAPCQQGPSKNSPRLELSLAGRQREGHNVHSAGWLPWSHQPSPRSSYMPADPVVPRAGTALARVQELPPAGIGSGASPPSP